MVKITFHVDFKIFKIKINYLSVMIPFDPPQAAWVGLVAALDNHLQTFIIGQYFQDNQSLINQYFHVMINPWMTTQKFFFPSNL